MVRGFAVLARSFVPVLLLLSLGLAGCDSLAEFGGDFSGSIVEGSFVRTCFEADLEAVLRFNPAHAVGSTRDLKDDERNWLTLRKQESGEVVFDAALEPIFAISSDALADFDFPGQKRLRNYMLLARPSEGALAERDVLVVVSLLATKKMELRVIARAAEDDPSCVVPESAEDAGVDTPRYPQYFGLFKLSK